MKCDGCWWIKMVMADWGQEFATCTNPKVIGTGEIIYCSAERTADSGCGKEGRFFQKTGGDLPLAGATISWVQRVRPDGKITRRF